MKKDLDLQEGEITKQEKIKVAKKHEKEKEKKKKWKRKEDSNNKI